jgi:hypothetical protein
MGLISFNSGGFLGRSKPLRIDFAFVEDYTGLGEKMAQWVAFP